VGKLTTLNIWHIKCTIVQLQYKMTYIVTKRSGVTRKVKSVNPVRVEGCNCITVADVAWLIEVEANNCDPKVICNSSYLGYDARDSVRWMNRNWEHRLRNWHGSNGCGRRVPYLPTRQGFSPACSNVRRGTCFLRSEDVLRIWSYLVLNIRNITYFPVRNCYVYVWFRCYVRVI
jgi:hypothetical protein